MEIHVRKNGQTTGPYTLEQAREALARNELSPDDDAWYPGMSYWMPLRSIVQPPESRVPAASPAAYSQPAAVKPQPELPGQPMGCCGWIIAIGVGLFALLMIVSYIDDPTDYDLHIEGTVGTVAMRANPNDTPKLVANLIASKVYAVATKHKDLTKIVVNLEFNPALLVDKYGHDIKGTRHMGTITVNDLAEVRRYEISGAYMRQNEADFASQISRTDYAGSLRM